MINNCQENAVDRIIASGKKKKKISVTPSFAEVWFIPLVILNNNNKKKERNLTK